MRDYDFMIGVCVFLFASLLGLTMVGMYQSYKKEVRLINECLKDGHKEYQCVGVIKGRGIQSVIRIK